MNTRQLGIIIESEYMERVRRKSFALTTLLMPLAALAAIIMPGVLASESPAETVGSLTATALQEAAGYATGLASYFIIMMSGTMVMHAVGEEKQNRTVEVMLSAVHPDVLLLGKIVAIGLTVITQMTIWAVMAAGAAAISGGEGLSCGMRLTEMVPLALYVVGAYILYSSFFAITGVIVDKASGQGNQLTLLVMLPLLISAYIAVHAVQTPDDALSFWSGMCPLSSAIVMPAKIPHGDVETWETAVSLTLLYLTAAAAVVVAAKTYRAAILLRGKKIKLRKLFSR